MSQPRPHMQVGSQPQQLQPQPQRPVAPVPTQNQAPGPKPKKESKFLNFLKKKWWVLLIIGVVLALISATMYLGSSYFGAINQQEVKGTQTTNQDGQPTDITVEDLMTEIRKVIKLPDEEPEIAIISNVDLLKGQNFFKDAENGDAVIIFKTESRGLLYRPSTKMILEYTKVDIADPDSPVVP